MWAKLGQLLISHLLLPLIEKGLAALIKTFKNKAKIKKKLEESKEKVERFKNAKTKDSIRDNFDDLG